MKSWGLPLWDLLTGRKKPEPPLSRPTRPAHQATHTVAPSPRAPTRPARPATTPRPRAPTAPAPAKKKPAARETAVERYDRLARALLAQHAIKVKKWRSGSSGVAWELKYNDGSVKRFIESPRPRGPMSMAIFLHEVGHHAIGFNRYKPRCLEEYHAWKYALDQMEAHNLNITDGVRRRVHASLYYAIGKARRRGLAKLPPELEPYLTPPPKSSRRRAAEARRRTR